MALFNGVLALHLVVERPGCRILAVWSAIAGVYVANLVRRATIFPVGYPWGSDAFVRVRAQAGGAFFLACALLFAHLRPRSKRAAGRTT